MIDWTMMKTAEQRAAQSLDARRAQASLSRLDFALAAWGAGLITEAERDEWLAGGKLPGIVVAALDQIDDDKQRSIARARVVATQEVERNTPLIRLMQAALDLTDAQIDTMFGIA